MSGTTARRRHSPAVYRRRRLLVLIVLLLVIGGLVWLFVAQPWNSRAETPVADEPVTQQQPTVDGVDELPVPGGSAEAVSTDATSTESAEPTTPAGTASCTKDVLNVDALADLESYGSGQNPQLSIRLTNTGEEDCAVNVGTSTQVFTITSGDDVWWRSTDCQSEPSDMVVMLEAGQTVTSATPLTWDRTRSAVDTCDATERAAAPGGGASYHLVVEIAGISSASTQLLLY